MLLFVSRDNVYKTLVMFAFLSAHSVSKQIAPSGDANEDLNLDNPNLYIMYGVGPNGAGAGALPTHITGAGNPTLSTGTFNPAVAEGEVSNTFPMRALLRAHGIIMLIAWPLLAVSGIFFAAWMRPALPNGEWFQASEDLSKRSYT